MNLGPAAMEAGSHDLARRVAGRLAAVASLALLVSTVAGAEPPARGAGLRDGEVLSADNWEKARGLLPEEVLEMYRKGDFFHTVREIRPEQYQESAKFLAASEKNAGRFTLGEEGTIIEVATGKNPPFIYGYPFPHIDPADPQAGAKHQWNFFYAWWGRDGDSYFKGAGNLAWLSRTGIDRYIYTDGFNRFYDGYEYPGRENPMNLLKQFLNPVTLPADLYGTVSLGWRYRDTRQDSQWAYVPALRRVRQVSPTNRSDGVLGSDMSVADNNGLDEKVEYMKWRYVGEGEVYCFFDKLTIDGTPPNWIEKAPAKDGGGYKLKTYWTYTGPTVALESREWKEGQFRGVSWMPYAPYLVKLPVYIVEAIPRDPYYLFGKIRVYMSKVGYRTPWFVKYDWKGVPMNVVTYSMGANKNPFTGEWKHWGAGGGFAGVFNVKMDRATVPGLRLGQETYVVAEAELPASLFDLAALIQRGK